MRTVKVAILGACGWMGKCHTMGYRNAIVAFPDLGAEPAITWIIDDDADRLARINASYIGARVSTRWDDALRDPEVDLVDICLPDNLHYEVAKAALQAGKHVYCEKPLTSTAGEALELATMADERGLITRVGHNYPRNPAHDRAKEIIEAGEIGKIVFFKASMHVDVLADPQAPFMWRCDADLARTGVVGDIASHVFSFTSMLIGPVTELVADASTVTAERPFRPGFSYGMQADPSGDGSMRRVTNSDLATILCKFRNGARGMIDVSRIASGRRFLQSYQVYGTRGALDFNYDNINRLGYFSADDPVGRQGYRAIDIGPENKNFGAFLPVANFGLGYNEFKAIEVADVIGSVASLKPAWPTFRDGYDIARLVDACIESSARREWVSVDA